MITATTEPVARKTRPVVIPINFPQRQDFMNGSDGLPLPAFLPVYEDKCQYPSHVRHVIFKPSGDAVHFDFIITLECTFYFLSRACVKVILCIKTKNSISSERTPPNHKIMFTQGGSGLHPYEVIRIAREEADGTARQKL